MPCSAEIEPLKLARRSRARSRSSRSHRREEGRLVGADRLRDVEMDVAVAEMAERHDARARQEGLDRRASPSSRNAGAAPTGTETSCLIEPPSKLCASDRDLAQAPEGAALLEAGGDARRPRSRLRRAPPRAARPALPRRPSAVCEDNSISTYQAMAARQRIARPWRMRAARNRGRCAGSARSS